MALSVFGDKAAPPEAATLAAALGPAYPWWNELREQLAVLCTPSSEQWGFSGKSTGWGLRIRRRDRIIVYLTPREGAFLASLALGERAVRAAHAGGLPAPVLALIDSARRYAEGPAVRVEVRAAADLETVRALAAIKLAN